MSVMDNVDLTERMAKIVELMDAAAERGDHQDGLTWARLHSRQLMNDMIRHVQQDLEAAVAAGNVSRDQAQALRGCLPTLDREDERELEQGA